MDPLRLARAVLHERFGYPDFRPGQDELIGAVLAGRDALGILPTGGGKSLCYQIPALTLGRTVLVISPLVSLMEDQARRAREAGIRVGVLNATVGVAQREAALGCAATGGAGLLFCAPERLESEGFLDRLCAIDIGLLAIDEAHCISEWGHDFRPAYRRIARVREVVRAPVLALTASATPAVRHDLIGSLRLDSPLVVLKSFDRPNLSWGVLPTTPRERLRDVVRLVRSCTGPALVYAATRKGTERAASALLRSGVAASVYHAGLTAERRSEVQADLLADRVRVVVATNAFGMGVDKPDVRLVVHAQLPATLESYYQEAGRAGRDGDPARCIALFHPDDQQLPRRFLDESRPPLRRELWDRLRSPARDHARPLDEAVRLRLGGLARLRAVRRFARTRGCRRARILRYFGEAAPRRCGSCDRCTRRAIGPTGWNRSLRTGRIIR